MKKMIGLLSAILVGSLASPPGGQDNLQYDIFVQYVRKISGLDCFSYNVIYRQRSLFDLDTVTMAGLVRIMKSADSIYFLDIVRNDHQGEMVFYEDTGWIFSEVNKQWDCAGKGFDSIRGSQLMSLVPVSLFAIRHSKETIEPYWRITDRKGSLITITFDITEKPVEISKLLVQVIIDQQDSMVYGYLQDADFSQYGGHQFQQTTLNHYQYCDSGKIYLPENFLKYPRVHRNYSVRPPSAEKESLSLEGSFPEGIDLQTLDGKPFQLPREGLIFMDIWYAGCYPCLKSAPVVDKLYREYGDRVKFYSVDEVDTDRIVIGRYLDKVHLTLPVILNKSGKMAFSVSGNNAYPAFILLDGKSRKVLWHYSGYSEGLEKRIREAIEEFL